MAELVLGAEIGFAAKRWPEAPEWTRVASDAGINAVQFNFDLLDPGLVRTVDAYARVRDACESRGIAVVSASTGSSVYAQSWLSHPDAAFRRGAEDWYRRAVAAAAALGASAVGGHMGALSARQHRSASKRAAAIARTTQSVLRIAEHAARAGLECLMWQVAPIAREYPALIDEVEELMEQIDPRAAVPVRLCLDADHTDEGERDPFRRLERVGPLARCIRLPQTGRIDPDRVVAIARALPQDELELMFEPLPAQEASDAEVEDDLRASAAHWRAVLDRAAAAPMALQSTRRSG